MGPLALPLQAAEWHAWRPAEEQEIRRNPHRFEERFLLPLMIAESCEFLLEVAAQTCLSVGTDALAGGPECGKGGAEARLKTCMMNFGTD